MLETVLKNRRKAESLMDDAVVSCGGAVRWVTRTARLWHIQAEDAEKG
jgi:hypothetical protein